MVGWSKWHVSDRAQRQIRRARQHFIYNVLTRVQKANAHARNDTIFDIFSLVHTCGHWQHGHAIRAPQELLVLVASRRFVRFALHPEQAADAHDAAHDEEVLREVAAREVAEEGELMGVEDGGRNGGGG